MIDDLNDYVGVFGGHPQARTPNIDRLARSGVLFTRAYSNDPGLRAVALQHVHRHLPPRLAQLFVRQLGREPDTGRQQDDDGLLSRRRLPGNGRGKVMHNRDKQEWDEVGVRTQYGPVNDNGIVRRQVPGHPSVPEPFRSIGPIDGSFAPLSDVPTHPDGTRGWFFWEWNQKAQANRAPALPLRERNRPRPPARRGRGRVVRQAHRPTGRSPRRQALLRGLRLHPPAHAAVRAERFFDMYPVDKVQLPDDPAGRRGDTHFHDYQRPESKGPRYFELLKQSYPSLEEGLRHYLQAYLACVAFVDEQVGKVVDAVDRSPFRDNTIVVLASDNGYNHGQKDFLFKNSPWEESTRIPSSSARRRPQAGGRCDHPVSLIDVYPTLVDLCRLTGDMRKNAKARR